MSATALYHGKKSEDLNRPVTAVSAARGVVPPRPVAPLLTEGEAPDPITPPDTLTPSVLPMRRGCYWGARTGRLGLAADSPRTTKQPPAEITQNNNIPE
jgi:hypothetical protein